MADQRSGTGEAPIGETVLERTAERFGIDAETLQDALTVHYASLLDRHSEFEREYDYTTVDDRRAYRVPEAVWDDLLEGFEFDESVGAAVAAAHAEQARLVFEDAVGVDERFADDESGVVVGIDTAEVF